MNRSLIKQLIKKMEQRAGHGFGGWGWKGNVEGCDNEGREEGREEGLAKGIVALIQAYQEFNVSREENIVKFEEKFNLFREWAEDYVRKYWK